jgi:hypothetical protein
VLHPGLKWIWLEKAWRARPSWISRARVEVNKLWLEYVVHVLPSASEEADTLIALLVTKLSASQLEESKRAFEDGAKIHLRPMMYLQITLAPDNYTNATLAHMRIMEDQAGNTNSFVVIDKNGGEQGAVWYVADFADENDVENGFAESQDVLMRALVRRERVEITHICWQQGNPPMAEEL